MGRHRRCARAHLCVAYDSRGGRKRGLEDLRETTANLVGPPSEAFSLGQAGHALTAADPEWIEGYYDIRSCLVQRPDGR